MLYFPQYSENVCFRVRAYKALSSPGPPVFLDEYGAEYDENAYPPALESDWPRIIVGKETVVPDRKPPVRSGRILLPVRNLADALGYTTYWDADDMAVTVQDGERIVRMTVGATLASVNIFDDGIPSETIAMDVAPVIESGRTLIPVRFLAEAFNLEV